MKKLLLTVLTIFSLLIVTAQTNQKIDSLLLLLKSDNSDTMMVNHLCQIAWEFQYSNPDTALYFANTGLQISINRNYKIGIADLYHVTGTIQNIQGGYSKAQESYIKSLKIYEDLADKIGIAKCYRSIGIIHQEQSSYDKALLYFFKSLKISEALNEKRGIAGCYVSIGSIKDQQGRLEESKGNVKQAKLDYGKALEYYVKSMKLYEELQDNKGMAACYGNIGINFREQGNNIKALEYYLKALKIFEDAGQKTRMIDCYINIGSIYGLLSDLNSSNKTLKMFYLKKAIEYGTKTFNLAIQLKDIPDENDAASILMEAYKRLGNFNKSLEYAERYIETSDSLFEAKKTKTLADMEAKYQNEKNQLMFHKEMELHLAENKKQNIVIGFTVFGLLLVLGFAVFGFRALRITRVQKQLIEDQKLKVEEANEELNQQNEEITVQHNLLYEQNKEITEANQQLQIREQELAKSNATKDKFFSIISHDLRSPFNILLNLSELSLHHFEDSDPEEIKENISSINLVANLTYNLLENLLQWATIQTGKSEPAFKEVLVNDLINEVFDLMHNVAIYKKIQLVRKLTDDQMLLIDQEMIKTVIRNLLSNAIKFTRADGTIVLETSKTNSRFLVSILDNGIGMNAQILQNMFNLGYNTTTSGTNNEKGSGLGLILCKEFVEMNRGVIEVESKEGKGSRFTISFPISEKHKNF